MMRSVRKLLGKVEQARKEKGLTPGELAVALGRDASEYLDMERGLAPITLDEFIRLTEILDLSVDDAVMADHRVSTMVKLFSSLSEKGKLMTMVLIEASLFYEACSGVEKKGRQHGTPSLDLREKTPQGRNIH